jgi:hypothetical protein
MRRQAQIAKDVCRTETGQIIQMGTSGQRMRPSGGYYGVKGLSGNSRDACLNYPGKEHSLWRVLRGGVWNDGGITLRATYRVGTTRTDVYSNHRGRLGWSFAIFPGVARGQRASQKYSR